MRTSSSQLSVTQCAPRKCGISLEAPRHSHTGPGSDREGRVGGTHAFGEPHQTSGRSIPLPLGKATCLARGGSVWTVQQPGTSPSRVRRCTSDPIALGCPPGLSITGQAWQQPSPGVCQPPRQAGTVPVARMAGSGFADVSKEAQSLGWVRPSPRHWGTAAPGPEEQRSWSPSWAFTEGAGGGHWRGPSLRFLGGGPVSG